MTDRYTKIVLTVIAGALVYLCVVMTAFPAVQAQATQRPGEFTGRPIEAVIVGWKLTEPLQIADDAPAARPNRTQHRRGRSHGHRRLGRKCRARPAGSAGSDSVVERPGIAGEHCARR